MSDFVILMVKTLNILARVSMIALICFAIYAFIFIPVFSLKWCALYVFSLVLVFCLERWSYNNFPYYDKDPWNDWYKYLLRDWRYSVQYMPNYCGSCQLWRNYGWRDSINIQKTLSLYVWALQMDMWTRSSCPRQTLDIELPIEAQDINISCSATWRRNI